MLRFREGPSCRDGWGTIFLQDGSPLRPTCECGANRRNGGSHPCLFRTLKLDAASFALVATVHLSPAYRTHLPTPFRRSTPEQRRKATLCPCSFRRTSL